MAKAFGYISAILGIMIIIFSKKITALSFIATIPKINIYATVLGVALVLVGVIFMMEKSSSSGKVKQAAEEVPIYEGEGKKRKIVGYKKESK